MLGIGGVSHDQIRVKMHPGVILGTQGYMHEEFRKTFIFLVTNVHFSFKFNHSPVQTTVDQLTEAIDLNIINCYIISGIKVVIIAFMSAFQLLPSLFISCSQLYVHMTS